MEIRLRPILLLLLLLLGIAIVAFGRSRLAPSLPPTPTPQPVPGPTPVARTIGGLQIVFADESVAWDWQITCHEPLATWLQQLPLSLRTLRITLVDQLARNPAATGIAYPDTDHPTARAAGACTGQSEQACQVLIRQGTPGADLDVAVTAAIPHAIRNAWLVRAPGGAEQFDLIRQNWSWDQFQPLLRKEGNAWYSTCLAVSRP